MGTTLVIALVAFGRNILGLILKPYETMRRIVDRGGVAELLYVALLLAVYFIVASLVKVAAFRPFLLTRQFVVLGLATAITYTVAVLSLWWAGKIVGSQGKLRGLAIAWGYTLIPTLVWFLITSLLYVLFPPPRTMSPQGVAFSVVFLVFSVTLFFWKATLAYLTVRFGLRLGLGKILVVFAMVLPLLALYSWGMYVVGIFRVPFL